MRSSDRVEEKGPTQWTRRSTGVSIQTRCYGSSVAQTRVVITPESRGPDAAPCIVDFNSEIRPASAAALQQDVQPSITVDVYRTNGLLTQSDIDTVELLLYLGHVRPPSSKASHEDIPSESSALTTQSDGCDAAAFLPDDRSVWAHDGHCAIRDDPFMLNGLLDRDSFFGFSDPFYFPFESMLFGTRIANPLGPDAAYGREDHPAFGADTHLWANGSHEYSPPLTNRPRYLQPNPENQVHQIKSQLESMGALVYLPSDEKDKLDWSDLAGYDDAKQLIEETLLLALSHPEMFDQVTARTRGKSGESNRPRMVLFNGPPGTGKTSTARIIASSIQLPLIYVSLESIVSKWFGESEKNLGKIFDLARALGHAQKGCVIFVDEIDSLASSRDNLEVHEASRRMLSILLRRLDGFDTQKDKTILICATNRERDLDEAFRSRVDVTVMFPLPSHEGRRSIIHRYAKHLTDEELESLASNTVGLSGRNIRDFCQRAERRWVATLLRNGKQEGSATEISGPPVEYYLAAALEKQQQQA